ncbi:MAG: hypothetical protein RLY31_1711 [Bacteroidota bacterium]|jgi:ferric-dicitrate binding protein FerR (iron transport regulator)
MTAQNTGRGRLLLAGAAALAIGLLGAGIWWVRNQAVWFVDTNIRTEAGEHRELQLPGGARVVLNAVSELAYDQADWASNPVVHLDGEAYFRVKGKERFRIVSRQGLVQVVGTGIFNVYARGEALEVMCSNGKVQVSNKAESERVLLGKKEQVRIVRQKMQRREKLAHYPAWFKGESQFHGVSPERAFRELERQFDVTVLADSLPDKPFSGKFGHQRLNLAMQAVCKPLGLTWRTQGQDTILVGR